MENQIERERLINDYLPFVKAIVNGIKKKFGKNFNSEELEAYGRLGLIDAAQKFDPKFSCSFKTYAYYRVKGAILDALRFDKSLWEDRTLLYMDGANSYLETGVIRETLSDDYNSFVELKDGITSLATIHLLTEYGNNSENKYLDREDNTEIVMALTKLNEKEREVIRMFYFEDASFSEIAKKLGISISAVSRTHKKAIERLRAILTSDEP
jgi:RNA polymerase sigma factor for flagellar operon FliA